MEDIKNYKSKPPKIIGSTKINHALRVKMELGCQEFVLMEAIVTLRAKHKPVTDMSVYQLTGLVPQEATMTLESLVRKGFIFPMATADGAPDIAPKWNTFFTSAEDEFDEFWTKDGKVCWTGSKPKAKQLYIQRRKDEDKEFLIGQRDAYFEFLEVTAKGGFNRPKMMCTVFLGAQERFMEDWQEYTKEELEKQEKKKKAEKEREDKYNLPAEDIVPSTTTTEERKRKYED